MLSRTWTRIAGSYAALVLLTVVVLGLLLGGQLEDREERELRTRLDDQARMAAYSATPLFAQGATLADLNSLAHNLGGVFGTRVTLIRPDGVVVGDSEEDPQRMENHATRPEVAGALTNPAATGSSSRESVTVKRRLLYVALAVTDPGNISHVIGVVRVAYPVTSVEQARESLLLNLGLAVLLVSLVAALLGTLLARSIAGPISILRETARRLGKGDLHVRAPINVPGEIGDLGRELNSMADRLSETIAQRTAERNQIAAVFAQMHDGIVITDTRGRIESMNPAAAQLLSVDSTQVSGRSLIEVTHDHELHAALHAALAAPSDTENRRLELSIGRHRLEALVTAVSSSDGSNQEGLVVLQDVTKVRRLERVRRDFIANIGHELRTPLASVKLLVETLGTAMYDDRKAASGFLRQIDVELDRLTQLVRELLELSKIESGQIQLDRRPLDVRDLLERTAARLHAQAARAGLTVTTETEEKLPQADADPDRVEQVLVNLLHNSIKFTPVGGHITLRARSHPDGVLISVHDTGVGIPSDDLPRIFERFYKVDKARTGGRDGESGTGLGLAIAKHIIQAHGGRIWVESKVGEGTTFFLTLPA